MAGLFRWDDGRKPGKGVQKDEPEKPRFVHFWALFLRKFWRLCQLNLLYLLFCIPIITIGPATAGLVFVLRNLADERPVFLFSDFWDAFRGNWKQSFAYSLLMLALGGVIGLGIWFYATQATEHMWMYLPAALSLFVGFVFVFMQYYGMLMIVTLDLPLRAVLKNAVFLAVLRPTTNLLTLLFTSLLAGVSLYFFPLSVPAILLIVPAWIGFIVCFNAYRGVQRFVIEPYRDAQEDMKPPEPH